MQQGPGSYLTICQSVLQYYSITVKLYEEWQAAVVASSQCRLLGLITEGGGGSNYNVLFIVSLYDVQYIIL